MKSFEIITEADARVLDVGETIVLKKGGQITPLAADTLKARRIVLLADDRLQAADENLAPVSPVRKVAIGSDHGGVVLNAAINAALRNTTAAAGDLRTPAPETGGYTGTAA